MDSKIDKNKQKKSPQIIYIFSQKIKMSQIKWNYVNVVPIVHMKSCILAILNIFWLLII